MVTNNYKYVLVLYMSITKIYEAAAAVGTRWMMQLVAPPLNMVNKVC